MKLEQYQKWSLAGFAGWIFYLCQPTGKKKIKKQDLKHFLRGLGVHEPHWASKSVLDEEKRRSKEVVEKVIAAWDASFTPKPGVEPPKVHTTKPSVRQKPPKQERTRRRSRRKK